MSAGSGDGRRIVVFLASELEELAHRDTRWGVVLRDWAGRTDQLQVVTYPRFRRRPERLCAPIESWLPGVPAWRVCLPFTGQQPPPWDPLVARAAGRAVRRHLAVDDATALVVTAPQWTPIVRATGAAWSFDSFDDWRTFEWTAPIRRRVADGYAALPHARAVTVVNQHLAEVLGRDAGGRVPVTVVANGVAADRFASPGTVPASWSLPDRPFAVYVGQVDGRLHLPLVAATVAAGTPVVIAGPVDASLVEPLAATGAQRLGRIDRADLPALLARAAVGITPHHDEARTRTMDAMKTLEYLAAGLPVVATPVADRPEFRDRLAAVDDPTAFARAVAERSTWPRARPAAPLRDWDQVADELWRLHVTDRA